MLMRIAQIQILIAAACFANITALAQNTVLVPQPPIIPPPSTPALAESASKGLAQAGKELERVGDLLSIQRELNKAEAAMKEAQSGLKPGETKSFVVVSKNKSLMDGGEFVGVEVAKPAGEPALQNKVDGGIRYVTAPQKLTGVAPLDLRSQEQRKRDEEEMTRKAEALRAVEAAAEKLKADKAAAERMRLEAEAAALRKRQEAEAAAAAAAKAKAAAEAAAKAEAAARRAEREATRDGSRLQIQIRNEIKAFKAAGGNYRAPAGSGSH